MIKEGKIEKFDRIAMNYYDITDKNFENDNLIFADEEGVSIYSSDYDLIERRIFMKDLIENANKVIEETDKLLADNQLK